MIVLSQFLECPVGAVCRIRIETFFGGVDELRIKHHAHRDGSEHCADYHHDGKRNHSLRESLTRILDFVYIRGNLLTTAHRKDKDRQRCEVFQIEGRNQILQTEIQADVVRFRIQNRCGEHHQDVKKRHHKHTGSGEGCHLL